MYRERIRTRTKIIMWISSVVTSLINLVKHDKRH